jgi:hypothetical protein
MVGIIPMLGAVVIDEGMPTSSLTVGKQLAGFLDRSGLSDAEKLGELGLVRGRPGDQRLLLSVTGIDRLEKLFAKLFDADEFLSPYGPARPIRLPSRPPLPARRGGEQVHDRLRTC